MAKLRKKAKLLVPIIRIGKKGLTEQQILEIKRLLEKKNMIKIKILKSAEVNDKDNVIEEIIKKTNSILINKTGNTFTIHKNDIKE